MTERADALAAQIEQAAFDLLAAVEASTPAQWSAPCADGDWTQGFAAYHAAAGIEMIAQMVKQVAEGGPFPTMTMAEIDAGNAEQARDHAGAAVAETAAMINAAIPIALDIVGSLDHEQLDRKVLLMEGMPEVNVEMMIRLALVGHVSAHLASISAAR